MKRSALFCMLFLPLAAWAQKQYNLPTATPSDEEKDKPMIEVYLPQQPNGCAVVLCPGGAMRWLSWESDVVKMALFLNEQGIAAIGLRYHLNKGQMPQGMKMPPMVDVTHPEVFSQADANPMHNASGDSIIQLAAQDAKAAIRMVREHADEWHISKDKVGFLGFSAGGHLASLAATHFNDNVYKPTENVSARPDFSILIYPVITMEPSFTHAGSREALIGLDADQALTDRFSSEKQVTKETPTAFLAHALNDNLVPYSNSISYANALREKGVECELHLYARGDHGLGARNPIETQAFWHDACEKWLRMNGWTK